MQPDRDQKNEGMRLSEPRRLAEAVRQDASISGLCHEGAWECAIDAIRSLDINAILAQALPDSKDGTPREPV
jgi:hypothetical protein